MSQEDRNVKKQEEGKKLKGNKRRRNEKHQKKISRVGSSVGREQVYDDRESVDSSSNLGRVAFVTQKNQGCERFSRDSPVFSS